MQPRRQQQQSILSFLQKQPPQRRDPAGEGTPPEKPPRPPAGSVAGIMERLVRPPQPQGRNQDASHVRNVEKAASLKNQVPSNERSSPLFSRPCNGEYRRVILFPEQSSDMAPLQQPLKHSLRSSPDEFVRASTLFPELGSNQTPLQEHPNKLSSESPNNCHIQATLLFEDFDVQTPSQDASKRIFLGPSHGADTPITESGSDQTFSRYSSKFSLISVNSSSNNLWARFK